VQVHESQHEGSDGHWHDFDECLPAQRTQTRWGLAVQGKMAKYLAVIALGWEVVRFFHWMETSVVADCLGNTGVGCCGVAKVEDDGRMFFAF
jgi:hypothetical protein